MILVLLLGVSLLNVGKVVPQAPARESVRIGVFQDLSGVTSYFGQATLKGVKLAAKEINATGGIDGRPVELIVEDDQGLAHQAATVAMRLVGEKKVHALIGEVTSGSTLAAAPIAQRAKVPLVAPAATHPAVTQVGDYIFRVCFIDPYQGTVLAQFAVETLKAKRVALLVDRNSPYSESLAIAFEERLVKLGGRVLVKQAYAQGDRDFAAQLVAIKASRPQVVLVPGYYNEVGTIAKQAKQIGLSAPLLGGDGWDSSQLWYLGGASLDGSYISNHYSSDDPSATNKAFAARYKTEYGADPDSLAALGYDAMKLLADAIKRAGTDGPALRDALASTKNFAGVTGSITMDDNRNARKTAIIQKLQTGKFLYYESVQPDRLQ